MKQPPTRVRRALVALALAVLTFGAWTAVGSAAADGVPGAFSVPAPHDGDTAVYVLDQEGDATLVTLRRGSLSPLRDADGAVAWAEHVGTHWLEDDHVVAVDADWSKMNDTVRLWNPSVGALWDRDSYDIRFDGLVYLDEPVADCLLHNAFQNRSVPVAGVRPLERCILVDRWLDEDDWRVVGFEGTPHDGVLTLRSGDVQASFDSTVPYPVDLVAGDLHLRLLSFTPGTNVVDPEPLDPDPAPALRHAARTPWGFNESGVEHPFLASEAYEQVAGNDNAAAMRWFQDNPEHAPVAMSLRYDESEQDRTYTWEIQLLGSHSLLVATVPRLVPTPDSVEEDLLLVINGVDLDEGRLDIQEVGFLPGEQPRLADLPDEWPTLRSLLDRYEGVVGPRDDDLVDSWGVRFECDEGCTDPVMVVRAGQTRHLVGREPTPDGVRDGREYRETGLEMRPDGRLLSRTDYHELASSTIASPNGADPAPGTDDGVGPVAAITPRLHDAVPTEVWVGATVASLVVGVLAWLWPNLKALPVLGLFSRVTGADLLRNPVRRRILDLVEQEPGIHYGDLRRRLGLSNGRAAHHLRRLVEDDLLLRSTARGYTCYLPVKGGGRDMMAAAPVLRSASARTLLEAIAASPGVSMQTVADEAGVTTPTASYHLQRLAEAGLVERTRNGRKLSLVATPAAYAVLARMAS